MRKLLKYYAKKFSYKQKKDLIEKTLAKLIELVQPKKVILIGSATTQDFDEYSDIDLVLIFSTKDEAQNSEKILYRNTTSFPTTVDFICVDEKKFEEKAAIGGIFFVAEKEGTRLL